MGIGIGSSHTNTHFIYTPYTNTHFIYTSYTNTHFIYTSYTNTYYIGLPEVPVRLSRRVIHDA